MKLSGEHVLRRWFRERMSHTDSTMTTDMWWVDPSTGERRTEWRDPEHLNPWEVKVREVCEECNRGWLNDNVETPVQEVLLAMMQGRSVGLASDDVKRVATWSAKTAMMRSLMDKGRRAVPVEQFEQLRRTLAPPLGMWVWVGYSADPGDTWTRHLRFSLLGDHGESLADVHQTTLVMGNLAVFVAGTSTPLGTVTVGQYVPLFEEQGGPSLRRVWPLAVQGANWPPSAQLTAAGVYDLSERLAVMTVEG